MVGSLGAEGVGEEVVFWSLLACNRLSLVWAQRGARERCFFFFPLRPRQPMVGSLGAGGVGEELAFCSRLACNQLSLAWAQREPGRGVSFFPLRPKQPMVGSLGAEEVGEEVSLGAVTLISTRAQAAATC